MKRELINDWIDCKKSPIESNVYRCSNVLGNNVGVTKGKISLIVESTVRKITVTTDFLIGIYLKKVSELHLSEKIIVMRNITRNSELNKVGILTYRNNSDKDRIYRNVAGIEYGTKDLYGV